MHQLLKISHSIIPPTQDSVNTSILFLAFDLSLFLFLMLQSEVGAAVNFNVRFHFRYKTYGRLRIKLISIPAKHLDDARTLKQAKSQNRQFMS